MKFSSSFFICLLSFTLSSTIYAADGGFDIGGMDPAASSKPRTLKVTHETMAAAREAAVAHSAELFHDTTDPVAGNRNGDMTVVSFMDYHCPGSEAMTRNISTLMKNHPNLRVIYKEYPIHGPESVFAAKAALASIKQGKYLEFHNAIMDAGKHVTSDQVMSIAKSLGLNVAQLKADMSKKEINNKIQATKKLGKQIGILGTPSTFFAQTDVSTSSDPDFVIFMMGKFPVQDLEKAIGYATH